MKILIPMAIVLFSIAAGGSAWWLAQPAVETPEPPKECIIIDPASGKDKPRCASCGDARHPTAPLLLGEYETLIAQYANDPVDDSEALDSLCYYGVQTRDMLRDHGVGDLDAEHAEFFKREISRTHAFLSVRVTDENGVVRISMLRKRVAFDQRAHHEVDEVVDVLPPEISGTVKRVGLYHIWARF
ncbi:MAG: hypothetical protein KDB32_11205 [Planctomycetes bacterium]|nr:hypothetical protein [Planctomycetota bacterium]